MNFSIPRRRQPLLRGIVLPDQKNSKGVCCMNRDTICVQGGYTPGNGEPRQIPIIQSTTFKYATSEDMGKLFDLEADGYFYSRLQNPTCDMVAKKICELEGGTAAMLTSSGQAANFFALFNICEAGASSARRMSSVLLGL